MQRLGRHSLRRHVRLRTRESWLRALALVACVGAAAVTLRETQADDSFSFDVRPPKLMVLFDGRVLYGQISERPGGYMIESPGSKQVIPFEMIRLTASSLEDAYAKQRDAMKLPKADDHLALAQWCFENKLYSPANEQLAAALKLEPNRSEARRMLQEIEVMTQANSTATGARTRPSAYGRREPQERTAAGISPAAQVDFVRRVQPILVNRCGNASCHGSAAGNEFKLINVRTGHRQQRLETETNLAIVLKYIDSRAPGDSRLLRLSTDAESRSHRGLFSGPAGRVQLEGLRAWVIQAARDQKGTPSAPASWAAAESDFASQAAFAFGDEAGAPSSGGSGIQQAVQEVAVPADVESPLLIEIPRHSQPIVTPPVTPVSGVGKQAPRVQPDKAQSAEDQSAFLRQILEQDRPDAFSPNEFNRKVHGGARAQ